MSETTDLKETLTVFQGLMTKLLEKLDDKPAPGPKKVAKVEKPVAKKRKPAPELVEDFEKWFITCPEDELYDVKRGQWECKVGDKDAKTAHVLLFHSLMTDRIKNASDVICIRPIGSKLTIFNGSRITYGRSWRAQRPPQQIAEDAGAAPIPFESVVSKEQGAGLNLEKLEILEWKGAEKLIIPPISRARQWTGKFYVVERHFAGAMVLRVEDKYFLFDADREEAKEHGFNPFFTQLPSPAHTVEEAYQLLMPQAVKDAIAEGTEVIRQGEFFFVKQDPDAMYAKITANKATTPRDEFFYDQLVSRLNLMGAAQVNCNRAVTLNEVRAFVDRCRDHSSGLLPETVNNLKAVEALGDYIKALEEREGAEAANPPGDRYVSGEQPTYTHLGHVHEELNVRLSRERGQWRGGKFEESNKPIGPDATTMNILYQRDLNAATDQGVGGRGRHRATAVFQPTPTEAYAIGAIFHTGREHFPRYLPGWWRIYPNTATASFTVSGDVD